MKVGDILTFDGGKFKHPVPFNLGDLAIHRNDPHAIYRVVDWEVTCNLVASKNSDSYYVESITPLLCVLELEKMMFQESKSVLLEDGQTTLTDVNATHLTRWEK